LSVKKSACERRGNTTEAKCVRGNYRLKEFAMRRESSAKCRMTYGFGKQVKQTLALLLE
jgi:hypothetical protein